MQQAAPAGQNEERLDFAAELHIVVQHLGKGEEPWDDGKTLTRNHGVLHGFTFKSGARNGSWPRAYLSLVWGTICCANLRATKTSKDTQLQWKMPTALQMARLKTGKNPPASCIMVACPCHAMKIPRCHHEWDDDQEQGSKSWQPNLKKKTAKVQKVQDATWICLKI